MRGKSILQVCGVAALAVGLIALPSPSRAPQDTAPAPPAAAPGPGPRVRIMGNPRAAVALAGPVDDDRNFVFSVGDEGESWLGVETQEVTAEKAKQLKLSAERGALVGKVLEDSPAAKAGLKGGDVITEINGQRVEGTLQFRRIIREIPAGRSVELTVWRDGRSQNITATLGRMEENRRQWLSATPQTFQFKVPEVLQSAPMPDLGDLEDKLYIQSNRPRLGIDAEDISGQLGAYFGAPEGEGILVRDVNSGSAAEKAGLKAGDVITSLNGERLHGVSELRSRLDESGVGKTVKLGILRNKSAMTLDVEIPTPEHHTAHHVEMRTRI